MPYCSEALRLMNGINEIKRLSPKINIIKKPALVIAALLLLTDTHAQDMLSKGYYIDNHNDSIATYFLLHLFRDPSACNCSNEQGYKKILYKHFIKKVWTYNGQQGKILLLTPDNANEFGFTVNGESVVFVSTGNCFSQQILTGKINVYYVYTKRNSSPEGINGALVVAEKVFRKEIFRYYFFQKQGGNVFTQLSPHNYKAQLTALLNNKAVQQSINKNNYQITDIFKSIYQYNNQ